MTQYAWHEAYMAALLETDWTEMKKRVQTAEAEIQERQRVLSQDHGGTPDERQAIDDALNGMKCVEREASEWLRRRSQKNEGIQSTL